MRSHNIQRNDDVSTHLLHDAEMRNARKELAAVKKAADDA
jgi:hypothetical protein